MPRLPEAKKDVASCEKARGTASRYRSAHVRMGKPAGLKARHRQKPEQTQGTETSKYLQEKKETSMSGVVAIETDRAQTGAVTAVPG